jgi:hypothetical protein
MLHVDPFTTGIGLFALFSGFSEAGSVQYRECLKSGMADWQGTTLDILLTTYIANSSIRKSH